MLSYTIPGDDFKIFPRDERFNKQQQETLNQHARDMPIFMHKTDCSNVGKTTHPMDAESEVDIDICYSGESSRCASPRPDTVLTDNSSEVSTEAISSELLPELNFQIFVPIMPPGLIPDFDPTVPPPPVCGIRFSEFEGIDMINEVLVTKEEKYSEHSTSSGYGTPTSGSDSSKCYGYYVDPKPVDLILIFVD